MTSSNECQEDDSSETYVICDSDPREHVNGGPCWCQPGKNEYGWIVHRNLDPESLDHGLCEKPLPACAFEEFQTVVDALKNVLKANDDFRAGMPPDWEGDPLQDACDEAGRLLALLSQERSEP